MFSVWPPQVIVQKFPPRPPAEVECGDASKKGYNYRILHPYLYHYSKQYCEKSLTHRVYCSLQCLHLQYVVPAAQRHGHRYYIEVDNIGEDIIFSPVAVL